MRTTKAMLEQQVESLRKDNEALRLELMIARQMGSRDHELSNRLLTIFERTAGEAQLRLSGAGSAAAANLEREKQETLRMSGRAVR